MNCPHCNLTMIDRPDLAGTTLTCPQCKGVFLVPLLSATAGPTPHPADALPSPRRPLAFALAVVGVLVACYFFMLFDTSVPTVGGGRVHNLGLMSDRLVGIVAGVGMVIVASIAGMRR
jgi:hypothetical protein